VSVLSSKQVQSVQSANLMILCMKQHFTDIKRGQSFIKNMEITYGPA